MLPGSSEKEAQIIGKRVQTAVSNCIVPLGGNQLRMEILYGVTDVYPDDNANSMIARVGETSQIVQEATV